MSNSYLVQDWMTVSPVIAKPTTTLQEAHRLMDETKIRHLPIVADDKLVSLVTINQIRRAELETAALAAPKTSTSKQKLADRTIADIMTPPPDTILPQTSIMDATKLLLKNKLSGLPVVDENGHLLGIITESDIFHLLIEQKIPALNTQP